MELPGPYQQCISFRCRPNAREEYPAVKGAQTSEIIQRAGAGCSSAVPRFTTTLLIPFAALESFHCRVKSPPFRTAADISSAAMRSGGKSAFCAFHHALCFEKRAKDTFRRLLRRSAATRRYPRAKGSVMRCRSLAMKFNNAWLRGAKASPSPRSRAYSAAILR
jgi:hypothetical protein